MTEPARIRYEVRASSPATHRGEFAMRVGGTGGREFDLVWPSWVPGSYWIQDRVRNVSDVRTATVDGSRPVSIRRIGKARWHVDPGGEDAVEIRYTVYGNELRTALFDLTTDHMFLAGGFVLPYVEGRRDEPHEVALVAPADWRVFAELPLVGADPPTFWAADYDELVDSPIDAGRPEELTIRPNGIPHRILLCGAGGNHDSARLAADLQRLVEATIAIFGESPVPSYTFFYHLIERPPQGLEHARSCACVTSPTSFRPEGAYRAFLDLTAHEYLHLYNVKRIRPKVFERPDYTRETYTRLLWAMEGTTSYLARIVLRRAGLLSPERFLSDIAEQVRKYRDQPGRLHQSLEEASLAAWVDFYHRYEETPNRSMSYYTKGELVSLCLDLELRGATKGAHSVESLWRALWVSRGRTMVGLAEDELATIFGRITGVDLGSFFDDYIRGTREVPFETFLARAGLTLEAKPRPRRPDDGPDGGYLGVEMEDAGGSARLTVVRDGSPAMVAGLSPGDELVAVDGAKVRFADVAKALERSPAGTELALAVFRRNRLLHLPVVVGESPPRELQLVPVAGADEAARRVYEGWVGAPWAAPKASGTDPD
ncbi:MAG: PDZ domain-containing protein [Thermoplasmata archaeon]|nr:PDZ domain-containing protein [Thermoplasmata archaeon]